MNAMTPTELDGVVERFDDLGALEEGWTTLSKADLRNEEETRRNVQRVNRALVLALLALLLFNSAGLVRLVQGLSIGPVQDTVIVMVETWHAEMERHGVTRVLEAIRGEMTRLVGIEWDEVTVADPGARLSGTEEKDRAAILRGTVPDRSVEGS